MPRRENITPGLLEEMLAKIRTGRYRKGTVFASFGYDQRACYMREMRASRARENGEEGDDFDLQVEQAMAIGEMRICDELHGALNGEGGDWRGFELMLRRIHRISDPMDEQRIIESKAQTKAIELAASPEAQTRVRDMVATMLCRRPAAARPPAEPLAPEAPDAG